MDDQFYNIHNMLKLVEVDQKLIKLHIGHLIGSTRSTKHKKRFIRNEKWTSPIFASFKEQTSPFFSND